MMYFIVIGDALIMGFMIGLVIWLFMSQNKEKQDQVTHIPLQDEIRDE